MAAKSNLILNILGCGSATPSRRHLPACQVIEHNRELLMIDCGEGAQRSMMMQGLSFTRLRHIFISHLHGDHCLGLPGLLSTLSLHQMGGTITVHTFAEGAKIFSETVDFFCRERTYNLEFNIIDPTRRQTILDTRSITVDSFPMKHRVPTVGFLLREKPKPRHIIADAVKFFNVPVSQMKAIKEGADFITADGRVIENSRLTSAADPSVSYAYCSDTLYDPSLAETVRGVNLLYHEATYADDATVKARERFHSTASQAARIAREAGVGRLILGHYSKAYNDEVQHLEQARTIFPDTILANEGLKIHI